MDKQLGLTLLLVPVLLLGCTKIQSSVTSKNVQRLASFFGTTTTGTESNATGTDIGTTGTDLNAIPGSDDGGICYTDPGMTGHCSHLSGGVQKCTEIAPAGTDAMEDFYCREQFCFCDNHFKSDYPDIGLAEVVPYPGDGEPVPDNCDPSVSPGCPHRSRNDGEQVRMSYFDLEGYMKEFRGYDPHGNDHGLAFLEQDGLAAGAFGCDDPNSKFPCRVSEPSAEEGGSGSAPDGWQLEGPMNKFLGVGIASNRRWRHGRIWYEIIPAGFTAAEIANINAAITDFNRQLGDRVYWRKALYPPQSPRIQIVKSADSCSAWVGKRGVSTMDLASWCITKQLAGGQTTWHPSIHHEMLHVVGIDHEQSRADRDNNVCVADGNDARLRVGGVNADYIRNDSKIQYEKLTGGRWSDYLVYDYNSIMHYSDSGFCDPGTWRGLDFVTACNGPTMTKVVAGACPIPIRERDRVKAQRNRMSARDLGTVRAMYTAWDWYWIITKSGANHTLMTFSTRNEANARCQREKTPRGNSYHLPFASQLSPATLRWLEPKIPKASNGTACIWVFDKFRYKGKLRDRIYWWNTGTTHKAATGWYHLPTTDTFKDPECTMICAKGGV